MIDMLTYKQNIFDILVKYEDGDSAYTIKSESGMRVERDDNKRFHYEDVPQITQAWKLLDSGLSPYLKCDK